MTTEKKRSEGRVSWPVALIVVVAILAAAGLYAFRSLRDLPLDTVAAGRDLLEDVGAIARAFREGTVTTSFISYATEVSGSSYLQFATLNEVEVFERSDEARALWGRIDLPDVIVQATAPVEYTYYLDLDGTWELVLEGETIQVLAPRIRYNTPAIDASALRYGVTEGSVFRDEDAVMSRLQAGLTDMAGRRAEENIPLVRELGRRKTAEFVDTWLGRSFGDEQAYRVEVVFADELDAQQELPEGPGVTPRALLPEEPREPTPR